MAHGWRGRAAGIGAAVAVCTGLGGCMTDEKKTYTPPPAAKGMTASPPANTRTGSPAASGPAAQWGQAGTPAPKSPSAGGFAATPASFNTPANPYSTGEINRPTVPGNYGAGAPIPGASPVAPSVGPAPGTTTGSQYYTPSGPAAGYPATPAGGAMPSAPAGPASRAPDYPSVQMADVGVLPPPPPVVPGHPNHSLTRPPPGGPPRSSGPSGPRRTRP